MQDIMCVGHHRLGKKTEHHSLEGPICVTLVVIRVDLCVRAGDFSLQIVEGSIHTTSVFDI